MDTAQTTHNSSDGQLRGSRWTIVFAGFILVAGIVLAVVGAAEPPPPKFTGKVADLLPSDQAMIGWQRAILPLAAAPELQAKVEQVLSYDDVVYCEFTRGTDRISIYIAYWKPGKMPFRDIARHTPDVCWTSAGWRVLSVETQSPFAYNGTLCFPAERRVMSQHGRTEHVFFWHLFNGKAKTYGTLARPPWYAPLIDMAGDRLDQRPEQWFIRISSNQLQLIENAPVYARLSEVLVDRGGR